MCSFVSQLQLHDGGVKIHEIIYEQVTRLGGSTFLKSSWATKNNDKHACAALVNQFKFSVYL